MSGGGHLPAVGAGTVEPQSLIVGEKEGLVPLFIDARDIQRPAARKSELIAMVVRLGHALQVVEVEVGVQIRVAYVLVGNEVPVVGAGLGGKADHIAGAESVLGRKRVARY